MKPRPQVEKFEKKKEKKKVLAWGLGFLTVKHILSLHHLLLLFLCVRRVHRQTPGLGLEAVGIRFDLAPQ